MPPCIRLRPERDRPLRSGHPWIFSGAIADLDPAIESGAIVEVRAAGGEFLGRGYINPRCTIAVRILTRADQPIDAAFLRARLDAAWRWRRRCVRGDTTAYRLINGEGDGLPGFLVDIYGEVAVLQVLTAGAERLMPWLVDGLRAAPGLRGILERSAGAVRRAEGLPSREGLVWGEAPADVVELREHGFRFFADLRGGQKTGFYLDQRPNRVLARRHASGARVLNAFAYSGSFGVYAAAGGAAEVVSVESSAAALALAERSWALNGLPPAVGRFVEADVFTYLRQTDEQYDLLVLDPPALVKHRGDLQRGARAYKDLNLHAFRRAAPGALVLTFSCSQHVGPDLFRKIVHGAAADAGRQMQLLRALASGPDHPTLLSHPEGAYLHGLLLRMGT